MKEQNYSNHVRVHPPYHFVGSLLVLGTTIAAMVNLILAILHGENIVLAVCMLTGMLGLFVTFALVRLYAMKVQDRVVRAEENFRHYMLTGKQLDARLTMEQIIALRFAGDEEFPALCERAAAEGLKPDEVKRAVQKWRADFLRV
ncbi:DUF6526 family protein [Ectobacillus ponti]|uniref:DUF6526 family protein n=1 Tax=Ectobacillus ponti TaxID=2961894 RepID=A0AA41X8N3_9BACI|nr:DUF6526 family protein [Ectobacillus ponti]MCP8970747.1 DUF6526 family protein [Ectobacillus ponti]